MAAEDFLATAISQNALVVADFRNPDNSDRPFADWYYEVTSLGIGPNLPVPQRPYIVWNEGPDFVHQEVRETSNARDRNIALYIYDFKGDFTRINRILANLRTVVKGIAPFVADDGTRCSEALWRGISAKFADDGYDSCTRYASIQLTVSE